METIVSFCIGFLIGMTSGLIGVLIATYFKLRAKD